MIEFYHKLVRNVKNKSSKNLILQGSGESLWVSGRKLRKTQIPMTHASSMFKQVLADVGLEALFINTPPEALDGFRKTFGVVLSYGDFVSSFWFSAAVLAVTTAVFYTGSLVAIKARRE